MSSNENNATYDSPSLHSEMEDLLEELSKLNLPPAHAQSPEGARKASDKLFQKHRENKESTPVGAIHEVFVERKNGQVPLRVYEPETGEGPFPCLVHIHGGGWVRGSLDTYDEFCRYLTSELDCLTFSVDYRLAPEHKFPTAVEDSYAAVQWIVDYGADVYNGDSERLAVIGDSAGGNLSAAVSLMDRDYGTAYINHQVLLYPVVDHAFDTDSYNKHADVPLLPRESMEWYWNHYLESELDGRHPYASPLQARDLSNLPSATVITAEFDPLHDEGEAFADRLRDADIQVSHINFESMMHLFLLFPEDLKESLKANQQIVNELHECFSSQN